MKVSEITTEYLRNYLRLDDTSFDTEIEADLAAAKSYVLNYTGLDSDHLDDYIDLSNAVCVLVSDMFENHLYQQGGTGTSVKENKIVQTILDHHRINLC